MAETAHRIYAILKTPIAPMVVPWAKVLEISSGILTGTTVDPIGGTPADNTVVQALGNGMFYSSWTNFDARFFVPVAIYTYNPEECLAIDCHTGSLWNYPLQYFLNQLTSPMILMQCSDNADLLTILAASQGISTPPTSKLSRRFC